MTIGCFFDILTYVCHNFPIMQTQRTTLRLDPVLKKRVHKLATEQNCSMQSICTVALQQYLDVAARQTAKKILFHTHDLGTQLNNLTRDDYYDDPVR